MNKTIFLSDISLNFGDTLCFANFTAAVHAGARIAVIGRNGSGKSSLLKVLSGELEPCGGEIRRDKGLSTARVAQIVQGYDTLSGAERFNKALTAALAAKPDLLLLDEPTNHLDSRNRASLLGMLKYYRGTLVIVSHDRELLRESVDTLWHIDNGQVHIFNGRYDDYIEETRRARTRLEGELESLHKDKKAAHKALMKEQHRAAAASKHGEKLARQGKWAPIVAGGKKRQAQNTAGAKNAEINARRGEINESLSSLYLAEVIVPKFSITAAGAQRGTVCSVYDGSAGYESMVLEHINFTLAGNERAALTGDNASGKSTFIKALLGDPAVHTRGAWSLPAQASAGYLDQHYANIDYSKTVLENIREFMPGARQEEIRDFLNDFLFRKQHEVNAPAAALSGGERARLSLALIAAKTPPLLILDEVTNNVDLETKEHIINVLNCYPGAVIAVSHERDFLQSIGVTRFYDTAQWK